MMQTEELRKRQERAAREPLIIAKAEDGFRVYAPSRPTTIYLVRGGVDTPTCSCPDFERHRSDPAWRCKHILAVLNRLVGGLDEAAASPAVRPPDASPSSGDMAAGTSSQGTDPGSIAAAPTRMILKRSVSPDGRIDSLSVEVACTVDGMVATEIEGRAARVLQLEDAIVHRFRSGIGPSGGPPRTNGEPEAHMAELVSVEGMDTKWGRRLFISVRVNGQMLKLFGSPERLGEAITAAGRPELSARVAEGMRLNLPCRVTTKPSEDGRYVNVDRVLSVRP